jgi:hypothetical protein
MNLDGYLEAARALESRRDLDAEIRQVWARISIVAGNVSGKGFESTSASADKRLPVSDTGKAQGDLEPFELRERMRRAPADAREPRRHLDVEPPQRHRLGIR